MRELLAARVGPALPLVWLALVALPVVAGIVAFVSRRARLGRRLTPSLASLGTDLAYVLLGPFTEVASRLATTLAVAALALAVGWSVGPDILGGFGPVVRQPRWLIVVEMVVLSDFIYYWVHRAAHTVPALWRFHAIHHSSEHLRWSSALRAHPAEIYLHVVTAVPLFLLGFPVDALVPMAPFITLYAILIHTGVRVRLRPVSFFVNTPVFHGIHHQRDIPDGTKNYAGFFPLFDALFGSYHLPDELPEAYGIGDGDVPQSFFAQLAWPWHRDAGTPRASDLPSMPARELSDPLSSPEPSAPWAA